MNSRLRIGLFATVAAVLVPLAHVAPAAAATSTPESAAVPTPDSVPVSAPGTDAPSGEGRYLVRFADGADVAARARALRGDGVAVDRQFRHAVDAAVVTASAEEIARIADLPGVLATAPDAPVRISGSWGLDRTDQRALPLDRGFSAPGTGRGVDVYVVDTGVRVDHAEFGGRVTSGWSAIADGYDDCNGHGTHVAGTVAGSSYGIAKEATVVPVRVLGCNGSGSMSDVVAGLNWIAAHHAAGKPAVVNLSLGGAYNPVVDAALQGVIDDGVVAAVAAGNSSVDACTTSPGRLPDALTVGASSSADTTASFSNWGSCLDLYAPGVSITSAGIASSTGTATYSGTSMAAPHVAGVAAVLLGLNQGATAAKISATVVSMSTTGVLTGVPAGSPNRLLHLSAGASATPPAPAPAPAPERDSEPVDEPTPTEAHTPGPARKVTAEPGARSAVVRWVRGTARGARVTRQIVVVLSDGRRVGTVQVGPLATRVRVVGLRPGRSYVFRVVEHSRVGASRPSLPSHRVRVLR